MFFELQKKYVVIEENWKNTGEKRIKFKKHPELHFLD